MASSGLPARPACGRNAGPDSNTRRSFWAYSTGKRLYSVHGVGDLTVDGVPEVAARTQNPAGSSLPVVYVFDGDAGLVLPHFADDFENGAPVGWSSLVP